MSCRVFGLTYSDLENELLAILNGLERVQNWGKLGGVELDYCDESVSCCMDSIFLMLDMSFEAIAVDESVVRSLRCSIGWNEWRSQLTINDGTNNLRSIHRQQLLRVKSGERRPKIVVHDRVLSRSGQRSRWAWLAAHLVNLAITDTSGARESAVDRETDGRRANGSSGCRGREGRACRAGDGGNAAIEQRSQLLVPFLLGVYASASSRPPPPQQRSSGGELGWPSIGSARRGPGIGKNCDRRLY